MLVLEIGLGVVVGLWCWGALVRWAHKPTEAEQLKALLDEARRND